MLNILWYLHTAWRKKTCGKVCQWKIIIWHKAIDNKSDK